MKESNNKMREKRVLRGASMLEAMVAILIFSIVIGGVLTLFSQSQRAGMETEYVYAATNLARNHLERLRRIDAGLLVSVAETDVPLDENGVPDDEGRFLRSTTVNTNYGGYAGAVVRVTVSVDYFIGNVRKNAPVSITALFR